MICNLGVVGSNPTRGSKQAGGVSDDMPPAFLLFVVEMWCLSGLCGWMGYPFALGLENDVCGAFYCHRISECTRKNSIFVGYMGMCAAPRWESSVKCLTYMVSDCKRNDVDFMRVDINKHAMYYGLVLGCIFGLNFMLSTIPSTVFAVVQFVVICAIPYVAYRMAKHCRDKVCGGYMSYWVSVWYVVQLFMYASMISATIKFLFFKFIKPDYLSRQFQLSMDTLEKLGLTSGMEEESMYVVQEQATNALTMSIQSIWVNIIVGFVVALIVSSIVKREKGLFGDE